MAMDRVEKRLKIVAAALDAAGIRYAVIGGNAVAAWVARVDPSATRTTKDVDLLVERVDGERVAAALAAAGFQRHGLRSMVLFVDPEEPSKRCGVHLVWAGDLIRPSYLCPAPSVEEVVRDSEGFWLLDLPALVRMKLTFYRDIDRVHVADLLSVGLVDETVRRTLPPPLCERLADIERSLDE